ncbi:MAG: hypothetical protein QOE72_898 [Chloroflexota bacterium]|jgi:hypothetical protein|nr:hypothetical protein [Chloroflexota bacterium]
MPRLMTGGDATAVARQAGVAAGSPRSGRPPATP